jgi:prolyl 4-hydroxylase
MAGGLTAFPRIGITAKPIKGSGLFWFNTKGSGESEPLSLHGGCPIIYGQKWVANQWVRYNSQMFARPCDKSMKKTVHL